MLALRVPSMEISFSISDTVSTAAALVTERVGAARDQFVRVASAVVRNGTRVSRG